ncbi:hypothetical protein MNBD_ALPHA06-382 [hydrothermal vent metagenome]|uniref:Uncharacterized protein n=1 Tax=hydrothermal vent metagenome TaxID=652676 RepID=A0A3B0RZ83_9ZZZZ
MSNNTAQKFAFDTVFDHQGNIVEEGGAWRQTILRSQSEQQVAEAFERGREAEQNEVEKTTTQAILALTAEMTKLLQQSTQIAEQSRKEAANLAMVVGKKIAGQALEQFAMAQVSELISQTLVELKGSPRIKIKVAPELATILETQISALAEQAEFCGAFRIEAVEEASPGAVALEWAEGAVEFDPQEVENRIETEISKWLAVMQTVAPEPAQQDEGDADV